MESGCGFHIVLVMAPVEVAESIAVTLVEERLAACVNVVSSVRSVYRWQGKVEREREAMLLIKTTQTALPALEERIHELHPYKVPEILAFPVGMGDERYLRWIEENVGPVQ